MAEADLIHPAQAHEINKATLQSIQAGQPPAPNPLLQRKKQSKPKSKSKPKTKKEAAIVMIEDTRDAELAVVSSSPGAAGGEEAEVLDLADQLLAQLGAGSDEVHEQTAAPVPIPGASTSSSAPTVSSPSPSGGFREKMSDLLHLKSSPSPPPEDGKKVSRQQARKLKKANQFDFIKSSAQAEVEAENDQSVKEEQDAINAGCEKLGVRIKDIEPDGHCLYSAIADQANVLGLSLTQRKESSDSTRFYASHYMRTHSDEFLPFLTGSDPSSDGMMTEPDYLAYCDTVEKTAEWGGQHEINALSKYFQAPIWVLQAGTDLVKVGDDMPPGRGPMLISYHRKMYGLGEHYNSLRRIV